MEYYIWCKNLGEEKGNFRVLGGFSKFKSEQYYKTIGRDHYIEG